MKRSLLCLLVLATSPVLLHANGDPVPPKVSDVQVVREDLRIDVKLPYTNVKVTYRLKDSSADPIHADYGFPVDFDGRIDAPGFSGDVWSASLSEVGVAGTRYKDLCLSDLVVLDGFVDLSEK